MTAYPALHAFNRNGLGLFTKVLTGQLADTRIDPLHPELASPVAETNSIKIESYVSAKEMAQSIVTSLGDANLPDLTPNTGLWAWLTFILRDELFKRNADDTLIAGEISRWFPTEINSYYGSNRHLVRMPVILLHEYGRDADHMLCGPPYEVPKIRYELTRQQDMFNRTFMRVARALYFNDASGKLKPGAGGTSGGTAYRLAKVYRQLDVTWDIEELNPEEVIELLPDEFDQFKPVMKSDT